MRYYLSAWGQAEALWRAAASQADPNARLLIDEHLLFAHMRTAPFSFATMFAAWRKQQQQQQRQQQRSRSRPPAKLAGAG